MNKINKEKQKKIKRQEEKKKEEKVVQETNEQSKFEKILYRTIVILGLVAIVAIILGTIITGSDKKKIANKYDSLTEDNVFETIKYKDLVEKIKNKETFQLLLISDLYSDADYFIYCVDDILKQINKKNELDETIYIIDPLQLDNDEVKLFKDVDKDMIKSANLIYYSYSESTVVDESVDENSTIRYNLSDFDGNYYNLLVKYLKDCYEREE